MTNGTTSVWTGHPVLVPAPPQETKFDCLFKIWDNSKQKRHYVVLTNGNGITVKVSDSVTKESTEFVTQGGRIKGSMMCVANRDYILTFNISGLTIGDRTYTTNPTVSAKATYISGVLSLLPAEMVVPRYIYPHYRTTISFQHPNAGYSIIKDRKIVEFEESYSPDNFNILVEGDSWFDSLSTTRDVFSCVKKLLEAKTTKPNRPVRFLQLQHFGQTAEAMLVDTGSKSQMRYLLEYLSKYRFDLILLSCGGNDFAIPFGTFLKKGLDPQTLMASVLAIKASNKLSMDFSYYPIKWSVGLSGLQPELDRAAVSIYVDAVLKNRFESISFPYIPYGDPYEDIVGLVYDETKLLLKFIDVEGWLNELTQAMFYRGINIPVLSHSYSYASFLDTGVSPILSKWFSGDGPFLHPALEAAGVKNPVLQALCIRALIDSYKKRVLDAVVKEPPKLFHYADVRHIVLSSEDWADEMHLSVEGSEKVAATLYSKIRVLLPAMFK